MALDRESIAAEGIAAVMADHFRRASQRGFPIFLDGEVGSNAVNSTPYAIDDASFRACFARWPGRNRLIARMDAVRAMADNLAAIPLMLVGGSFLDPTRTEPRDVDVLMFYETAGMREDAAQQLVELRRVARAQGVDVRFIPLGGDKLMLVKVVSFFTTLYNRRKGRDEQVRGLVIVDCVRD